MKRILSAIIFFCITYGSYSQAQEKKGPISKNKGVSISLGVNASVGDFSSTHIVGIAVDCSPTSLTFGVMNAKKFAFTYNGGVAYYFGKNETVSGYPYQYPGYLFIHAFSGILYNPIKGGGIILTAGPALGIYNGNTQFNIGSKLEASYYISSKIAIGPAILLMKESGANPIWAAELKATMNL